MAEGSHKFKFDGYHFQCGFYFFYFTFIAHALTGKLNLNKNFLLANLERGNRPIVSLPSIFIFLNIFSVMLEGAQFFFNRSGPTA